MDNTFKDIFKTNTSTFDQLDDKNVMYTHLEASPSSWTFFQGLFLWITSYRCPTQHRMFHMSPHQPSET